MCQQWAAMWLPNRVGTKEPQQNDILCRFERASASVCVCVMATSHRLVAGIEAGGTSFSVALADRSDPTAVVERVSIPTTTPQETLAAVVAWLKGKHFCAIGVACFGPVELNKSSPLYGHITTTPKVLWRNTDSVGALREFGVPIAFDTDVNAPAISEVHLGGHPHNLHSLCYVTVGTGIGVGAVSHARPVHGHLHPECGQFLFCRRCRAAVDLPLFAQGTCLPRSIPRTLTLVAIASSTVTHASKG